ncbi:MAG: HAD-IA family hydrolase [Rhodopila sp.]|nr:HAD-IA family hydrolase [Rhodopila sp.]
MARTLLLDLDGTLVDTVPDLAAALNRLMRSRGLTVFSPEQVTAMVGDGVAVLVARAFAAHDRLPDDAALVDFVADYEDHVAVDSRLYPNVLPVLTSLVRDDWRLAVCTNNPEQAARRLLQAVGVLPLLCAVGGGDSFPVRKPDPAHLLATLARAAGTTDAALMVGDHHNDVVAARGAGIPSIFAGWGYGSAGMADGCAAFARDIAEAAAIANRLLPRPV